MNRLLLLLVGCMCAVGKVGASDKIEDYIYVFIWNSDGTNCVYKCADRPAIIPTKECLLLRVNGTEIQYPINEFRKFSFGKTEDFESGIQTPSTQAVYEITQNAVRISGLKNTVTARIYSADGKNVSSEKSSAGRVTLDISQLKAGVYVVKCGTENFKFLKK